MRFWDTYSSWEEAEKSWDKNVESSELQNSLVPSIVDRRFLRLKALCWALKKDTRFSVLRHIVRRPFTCLYNYLKSIFFLPSYHREEDFFCFGVTSVNEWMECLKKENTILVLGFSYCQKPKKCPSVRFSDQCMADPENSICRQCFIGKCLHTLPGERTVPILITTLNAIGKHMVEAIDRYKGHQVVFLITSCEMAIEMGGDFANMVASKGLAVKLGGRFCNTWRAFQLAEDGIKPGVTALKPSTQKRVLLLLRHWRECCHSKQRKDGCHEIGADGNKWGIG